MSQVLETPTRSGLEVGRFALSQARQIGLLFFFSGFAALIYQLVWQRSLFRILGVNIEAVTIVVTAFMLGLGLGSLAGGALSKRLEGKAIPLLAGIEAATALFGLFSLSIFESVGALAIGAALPVLATVALCLVLVPTLLMGATLPILVSHLARTSGHAGQSVGFLYFVNTIGAAVGCLAGAIVIFPFIGMQSAIWLAVAMNAAVAIFALRMHLAHPTDAGARSEDVRPQAKSAGQALLAFPIVLALGAAGGFVSLSYEIFLVRIMSFATGGLAFAFALTLAAFLTGIASGSRVAGEFCALPANQQASRVAGELALALVAGVFCLPALRWFGYSMALQGAIVFVTAYLVARAFGLLMPFLTEQGIAVNADTGAKVSWLYVANIAGSACGSVLTGFVLMNAVGLLHMAQMLAALALAALLAFAIVTGISLRRPATAIAIALSIPACFALPHLSADVWDRLLHKDKAFIESRVAEVVENRSGVIAVTADGIVYGNGMYDGRFNTDLTNDANGVIRPFALSLLHPAPKRVLMIGLSSGSWARIIASNPMVESLTVVEINPGYVELAGRHGETKSILADPKIRIVADDGRRWLAGHADARFDMIVSNTTFNFRANISNLLSREFLELAASRLAPGGVLFYNTTGSQRVQHTACLAFPNGLRFTNHMAISKGPMAVDFDRWRKTLLEYRIDGKPVLDLANPRHVAEFERLLAIREDWPQGAGLKGNIEPCASILQRTAGVTPITDDNMGTEWRAPLELE